MPDDGIGGRVALVTGAAQGIGAAIAAALTGHGAHVALVDRDAEAVHARARTLPRSQAYVTDVADPTDVERTVAAIEDRMGPIGICVSNAGVLHPGPMLEITDEAWRHTWEVNTSGVLHLARSAGRRMAGRGQGTWVTVASNAAGVPRVGMAAYAASKAAAAMLTRCLGLELAPFGVRCNVVAPGSTDTAMQHALWSDDEGPARVVAGVPEQYRLGIPLRRIAAPADIADAVVFLASDRARHITMQTLCVDGGATLGV